MRKLNRVFVTCQANRNFRFFPFHLEPEELRLFGGFRITLEFLRLLKLNYLLP